MCAPKSDPAHEQSFYPLHQKLMINCHLTSESERDWKILKKAKKSFRLEGKRMMKRKILFMIVITMRSMHRLETLSHELCHPFPLGRCSLEKKLNFLRLPHSKKRKTLSVLRWKIFVHSKGIKICWLKIQFRFFCLSKQFRALIW